MNTEAKPFLTEEELNDWLDNGSWRYHSSHRLMIKSTLEFADGKANARIAELEKRLSEMEIERDDIYLLIEKRFALEKSLSNAPDTGDPYITEQIGSTFQDLHDTNISIARHLEQFKLRK